MLGIKEDSDNIPDLTFVLCYQVIFSYSWEWYYCLQFVILSTDFYKVVWLLCPESLIAMACENQEAQAGVVSGCHLHKVVIAQGEQSAKEKRWNSDSWSSKKTKSPPLPSLCGIFSKTFSSLKMTTGPKIHTKTQIPPCLMKNNSSREHTIQTRNWHYLAY